MIALLLLMLAFGPKDDAFEKCLPSGVSSTDVVSAQLIRSGADGNKVKIVTVKDRLMEMKARCQKGVLVDQKGREIRFYRLKGCWGNPPEDYLDIMANQAKELEELRKKYTVIEMTCNPSGLPPQLISQTDH